MCSLHILSFLCTRLWQPETKNPQGSWDAGSVRVLPGWSDHDCHIVYMPSCSPDLISDKDALYFLLMCFCASSWNSRTVTLEIEVKLGVRCASIAPVLRAERKLLWEFSLDKIKSSFIGPTAGRFAVLQQQLTNKKQPFKKTRSDKQVKSKKLKFNV